MRHKTVPQMFLAGGICMSHLGPAVSLNEESLGCIQNEIIHAGELIEDIHPGWRRRRRRDPFLYTYHKFTADERRNPSPGTEP